MALQGQNGHALLNRNYGQLYSFHWLPRIIGRADVSAHAYHNAELLWPFIPLRSCTNLGITMVNGTLGPLAATEAHLFDAVVGDLGTSDGGIYRYRLAIGFQCCIVS